MKMSEHLTAKAGELDQTKYLGKTQLWQEGKETLYFIGRNRRVTGRDYPDTRRRHKREGKKLEIGKTSPISLTRGADGGINIQKRRCEL